MFFELVVCVKNKLINIDITNRHKRIEINLYIILCDLKLAFVVQTAIVKIYQHKTIFNYNYD